MAISAPTKLSDFSGFITPEQSAPIFADAQRQSVVQSLSRQVPLGASGKAIPIVTTRPTANWTAEGVAKHKTSLGMELANMVPKKLTAIAVASTEVIRANPGSYAQVLRSELAGAFALAFDYAALYNLGGDGTGSGPFDHWVDETTKRVELGTNSQGDGGIHADIVDGLSLLVNDGRKLRGFAFDDVVEPVFLRSVDSTGRPIYIDTPLDDTTTAAASPGRLIGRPSYMNEGVASADGDTVGFGGNWSKTAWGVVGGISFRTSTEASVTINGSLVSLFENNLVAVLAEAEYGWVMSDVEDFVAYDDAVS
jgi:HK97 family phage major capsid protein